MPSQTHILQIPEIPCKTGHSGAIQGEIKQWLKYYLSATAVFNGCCESLGFKGFFDDWRIIYTLFIPLEDRIGIIEK